MIDQTTEQYDELVHMIAEPLGRMLAGSSRLLGQHERAGLVDVMELETNVLALIISQTVGRWADSVSREDISVDIVSALNNLGKMLSSMSQVVYGQNPTNDNTHPCPPPRLH